MSNFSRKSKKIKRELIRLVTNSFRNKTITAQEYTKIKEKPLEILVIRANHRLGNQLLVTPLIQELQEMFPAAKIDIMANGGLSNVLFANYPSFRRVISLPRKPLREFGTYIKMIWKTTFSQYDIAVAAVETSNSSKIFTKLVRAKYKFFRTPNTDPRKPQLLATYPVFNMRHLVEGYPKDQAYPPLDIKLTADEIQQGKQVLSEYIPTNTLPTVVLFTYATKGKKIAKSWWKKVVQGIENNHQVNIVEILPKENVSQVDFAYPHYYSKDIRDMASFLANCDYFIGADSGIMHLAAASGVTTLGLFKFAYKMPFYTPYGGNNDAIEISEQHPEKMIKELQKRIA